MELPVFFELDGDGAAMLPLPDGGVRILKSPGSPNIADFMATGSVVELASLPSPLRADVEEALARQELASSERDRDVFFALDDHFAAILPTSDGGAAIVKSPGAPNIADFMATGTVVELQDMPKGFRASVAEVKSELAD